jgi:ABC-2 type transport system ATP-binding protein
MHAIRLTGVTKRFGELTAVNDLSLHVPEGSIYGFIGPNGSGKTTTMRMIVGIFGPDSGRVELFGEELTSIRAGLIGYLPEERGLYRKMSVRSLLEFHAELRGGSDIPRKVSHWLERLGLAAFADRKIETLSKGMTQKVQFIAAVTPQPRLVILDEPFSGLDPVSAEAIREAILEMRRSGTTVVLSTHDMSTAEAMCDSILMIFRGRKVLDGTLAEIQDAYGNDTIQIRSGAGPEMLARFPGVEHVRDLGRIQEVRMARGADPQEMLRALISCARVDGFTISKPSLHDIFVRIAGPATGETEAGKAEAHAA